MKKVVVLGDTLVNNEPLGIQRFAYEILRELDLIEMDYLCELLIPEGVECKITYNRIKIVRYGKHKGFWWRQMDFPNYVKKQNAVGVDLTLGLIARGCVVTGIYDCIYESFSADFIGIKARIRRLSYRLRAKLVIGQAKKIITISDYSKKEIQKYYKIPDNKIDIIHCAWQHMNRIESDNTVLTELELNNKSYCFALGSSLPHKNFKWIVAAAIQNPNIQFVVTGTNRLSNYAEELNVGNLKNIIFTGYLPDEQIKALMENCFLFVQPSFIEGFCIPPLEALSCGAQILISNSSCLPEIYGDSAHYCSPYGYEGIVIDGLINVSHETSENILDKYTWKKSAMQLQEIFTSMTCD